MFYQAFSKFGFAMFLGKFKKSTNNVSLNIIGHWGKHQVSLSTYCLYCSIKLYMFDSIYNAEVLASLNVLYWHRVYRTSALHYFGIGKESLYDWSMWSTQYFGHLSKCWMDNLGRCWLHNYSHLLCRLACFLFVQFLAAQIQRSILLTVELNVSDEYSS